MIVQWCNFYHALHNLNMEICFACNFYTWLVDYINAVCTKFTLTLILFLLATPVLDFIPIAEQLVFTDGQDRGDSVCTDITIISDFFVETQEVFEVVLLPNPEDLFAAIIQAGKDRALVTISDREDNESMCILCFPSRYMR